MKKKMLHEYTLRELLLEKKEPTLIREEFGNLGEFGKGLAKVTAWFQDKFAKVGKPIVGSEDVKSIESSNDTKLSALYKQCSFWKHMADRWTRRGQVKWPDEKAMKEIVRRYTEKYKDDPDIDLLDADDPALLNAAHLIAGMEYTNQFDVSSDFLNGLAEFTGAGDTSTSKVIGAVGTLAGVGVLGASIGITLPVLATYFALSAAVGMFAKAAADEVARKQMDALIKMVVDRIADENFDGVVDAEELINNKAFRFGSQRILDDTRGAFMECWVKYEQWIIDELLKNPYQAPTIADSNSALRDIFSEVFEPELFALETGKLPKGYDDLETSKRIDVETYRQLGKERGYPEKRKKKIDDFNRSEKSKRKERRKVKSAMEKSMELSKRIIDDEIT